MKHMNPDLECTREATDEADIGGIALVGILIGSILLLAGVLGQSPVIKMMAEAYGMKSALSAGQTLLLGGAVVVGSSALFAWSKRVDSGSE
jgi:hypothetical protein